MPDRDEVGFINKSALRSAEFKHERDIFNALTELGHRVDVFGLYDDLMALEHVIESRSYDLIFNQCETFLGSRNFESQIAAFCELKQIPITGASSHALDICKDKALSKKIVSYDGVCTPQFVTTYQKIDRLLNDLTFPVICKPLGLEASEGVSAKSMAYTSEEAQKRAKFLKNKYGVEAIVEEYIAGRELYVGILDAERLCVFPPQELKFRKFTNQPKIATYRVKWDKQYRKKWGIDSDVARNINRLELQKINQATRQAFRSLRLSGFARMDFRLTESGDIYFIEANPNPALGKHDDFAWSAKNFGMTYVELIDKIVKNALRKNKGDKCLSIVA